MIAGTNVAIFSELCARYTSSHRMTTAVILIVIALLTVLLIVYLVRSHRRDLPEIKAEEEAKKKVNPNIECCGAHEVCEAETLLTLSEEIIYYSDEELDLYRGKGENDYSEAEIDEFREVLLTLQLHEVSGWLKSLQLRQVCLPSSIREEALMIVDDFRRIRRENREKKQQ